VTGWCVEYISSTGLTTTELACVDPPDDSSELWLTAGGYLSFATTEFEAVNTGFSADFTFAKKLSNTAGHIKLIDSQKQEIDRLGWGNAVSPEGFAADVHNTGEVMSRDLLASEIDTNVNLADFSSQPILSPIESGLYEKEILIDVCPNIDGLQLEFPDGLLADENGDCVPDVCPNIDGLQVKIPADYEKLDGEDDCTLIPLEDATLIITELLPNAPSFDKGLEFIEIFNPNSFPVDLVGYTLQLGLSFSKEFTFVDSIIQPDEYLTFSDIETGIVLPNTTASSIRLIAPAGNVVSETGVYSNAGDDVSWAIVSDVWIYTNQITPGSANKPYLEPAVDEVLGVTSVLAPCPAGKVRNPATNRCKNVVSAVSQLTLCAANQFRNPATNRCKNIVSTVSQLIPCAADQFRNPATNRCKKITSSSSSLVPCKEGQERNPETNRCRNVVVLGANDDSGLGSVTDIVVQSSEGQLNWPIIFASILGTLGYMVYEWRTELLFKLRRMRA